MRIKKRKIRKFDILIFSYRKECFMCGLDTGYRIYNTDPLKENAREGKSLI
jgi:hypothetical protein